jgi:ureidoacrylate peracid hydrolase
LHERSISTVAVVGVDTHICVEGTVRQGYDLGYRMIVLSDLVATRQSEFARHETSLAICGRYFALTMESDAFLQLMNHEETIAYKRDAV